MRSRWCRAFCSVTVSSIQHARPLRTPSGSATKRPNAPAPCRRRLLVLVPRAAPSRAATVPDPVPLPSQNSFSDRSHNTFSSRFFTFGVPSTLTGPMCYARTFPVWSAARPGNERINLTLASVTPLASVSPAISSPNGDQQAARRTRTQVMRDVMQLGALVCFEPQP